MSYMTPQRLKNASKIIKEHCGKIGTELLAHIDAQQRTIEQLQADKAQVYDWPDSVGYWWAVKGNEWKVGQLLHTGRFTIGLTIYGRGELPDDVKFYKAEPPNVQR